MNFVGRTYELEYLNRLYAQMGSSFCVVYGRRRIGKTRLLTHWLETKSALGFYWVATDTSATALLRSFSQTLYRQLHGVPPADPGFTYYDWDEAFRVLARCAQQSPPKLVVILDEFTYALKYGWLTIEEVCAALQARPTMQHVVITGRGAPEALIAIADTVSEINLVKHAYKTGVQAMPGIEW